MLLSEYCPKDMSPVPFWGTKIPTQNNSACCGSWCLFSESQQLSSWTLHTEMCVIVLLRSSLSFLTCNSWSDLQLTCLTKEIIRCVCFVVVFFFLFFLSLSYQASVLHQDMDREPGTVDLNYMRASHFIRPFYSTSRSFLSIVHVPEMMPCGKKQAIQVDFRIYQEDLEHGPKRVIFSYLVSFWRSAGSDVSRHNIRILHRFNLDTA